MTTTDQPNAQRLQALLERRQRVADDATAALAHGSRKADRLYGLLAALEDRLERDHPRVVAAHLGEWATRDANQLAGHQEGTITACGHCQADRAQNAAATPRARTA
ncbi:MAG: hypothetical protein HHJ11_09655 [Phycicoccus sp.]|nr:hypothetical protein [Phycicoccus sp.]